ncbi:hypothetical protein [Geodermatophilus sp. SYSU D00815]
MLERGDDVLIGLIVACEIAFWVLLLGGLLLRYAARRPRAGAVVLVCVPLVDLVLLGAAALDVRSGGTASLPHALAAVYLGVSVGFGHRMVRWADERVAHRFGGGPRPVRPPEAGPAHARHERRMWLHHLLAWGVGVALLGAGVVVGGGLERTAALWQVAAVWTVVLLVDLVVSMSYTVWPRPQPTADRSAVPQRV